MTLSIASAGKRSQRTRENGGRGQLRLACLTVRWLGLGTRSPRGVTQREEQNRSSRISSFEQSPRQVRQLCDIRVTKLEDTLPLLCLRTVFENRWSTLASCAEPVRVIPDDEILHL
ncbi:uncharacterized protein LOC118644456 [Monomorium pharaonis]|uniref:uncharacterized protein LOC118644456 n=1 Tax=Monomorium pharaonis TaxID=307658 RepID=UPI001745E3E5|nr:uncharacterized protein LOC118644456 [Monomorium pharaonis]